MTYHLLSERPEIKLSEVTLKKILTDSEIHFKFLVLKNQDVEHTSEIECINKQLHIYCYTNEEKLTLHGDTAAMAQIVSLIKNYYGSLSNFKLKQEETGTTMDVLGNTSEEQILDTF